MEDELNTVIISRVDLDPIQINHLNNQNPSLSYDVEARINVNFSLIDYKFVESPDVSGLELIGDHENATRYPSTSAFLVYDDDDGYFCLRDVNSFWTALNSIGLQNKFHDQVIETLIIKVNEKLSSFIAADFCGREFLLNADVEISRVTLPEIGGGSPSFAPPMLAAEGGDDHNDVDDEMGNFELAIQGIVNVKQGEVVKGQCVICLEDLLPFQKGKFEEEGNKIYEVVKLSKCKHVFHEECIISWFMKTTSPTCPLCRST